MNSAAYIHQLHTRKRRSYFRSRSRIRFRTPAEIMMRWVMLFWDEYAEGLVEAGDFELDPNVAISMNRVSRDLDRSFYQHGL